MNIEMKFVCSDADCKEAFDISAHDAAGVALAHLCNFAATDVAYTARLSNMGGPGLAQTFLSAWLKTFEQHLLSAFIVSDVPGAKELLASRAPLVERLEAERDETGRIVATTKRMVRDLSA